MLGRVTALIDTGPHSVLCVRRPDAAADESDTQAERLIPFVAAYVDAVDLAARRIVVDWGLDY
jgi:16S rRNA processing protein RimM